MRCGSTHLASLKMTRIAWCGMNMYIIGKNLAPQAMILSHGLLSDLSDLQLEKKNAKLLPEHAC